MQTQEASVHRSTHGLRQGLTHKDRNFIRRITAFTEKFKSQY